MSREKRIIVGCYSILWTVKRKKLTTYVLSHTHKGVDCPGKDPELMKELAAKFSKDNLAKKNVNILDVFVDQSCMLQ